jgi:hypothetical protein
LTQPFLQARAEHRSLVICQVDPALPVHERAKSFKHIVIERKLLFHHGLVISMFKASVFLHGAAADYSPDRHGRIQRSWTGSARDFIAYGNRAVERLRGPLFYFWQP